MTLLHCSSEQYRNAVDEIKNQYAGVPYVISTNDTTRPIIVDWHCGGPTLARVVSRTNRGFIKDTFYVDSYEIQKTRNAPKKGNA